MKKTIALLLIMASVCALAQDQKAENDNEAIIAAAMNYVEGAYQGDAERMAKSLYPGLNKIMVAPLPNGQELLSYTTYDQLLEGAKAGLLKLPEEQWNIKPELLKVHGNIATVKVTSAMFTDMVNLGKVNGKWMVVNITWIAKQLMKGANRPDDQGKIQACALDYVDGFLGSDPGRVAKGVHDSLHKLVARKLPNGREFFQRIDKLSLVKYAEAKIGGMPADKRNIEVEILDITENIAAVSIPSARFIDHVLMSYINGKWQIVNVIWTPRK